VVAGVLLITGSTSSSPAPAANARTGFLWAGAAGVLWGSYFIPAQWAAVPAQVSNFPLALGILAGALVLALPAGEPVRAGVRATGVQLGAGVLFGIGNLALLALVARVGTGTGFTIAQLSLPVNAGIGIWLFHVPEPGTRAARKVLTGIVIAGLGGCLIAAMR
jgi:glucose uptake protein